MRSACLILLSSASLSSACASKNVSLVLQPPGVAIPTPLAVAPAALMADLPGAVEADAFDENLIVGDVHLSGGYITLVEQGSQARSKEIALGSEDAYAAQSRAWLDAQIQALLVAEGVEWLPATGLRPEVLPPPARAPLRGSHPEDGSDDVNLPRYSLTPAPLSPESLVEIPAGAGALLVPLVAYYYTHNGGWFIGQDYGCPGGARIRVFWTLYDANTGAPLGWGDVDARELSTHDYSPNRARLEDYLIAAESSASAQLRRHLGAQMPR